MTEVIVLSISFVLFCVALVVVTRLSLEQASRGFREALEISRETRYLQSARISTLENRLQADTWQEFAALQQVPNEGEKAAWSEQVHAQTENNGLYTPEQLEHLRRLIEDGSDIEGPMFPEDMESSTIG
jgi:hypothetical protein